MKFKSKEFLALRDLWYARLKEEGFDDIEDNYSPMQWLKNWHSSIMLRPFKIQGHEHLQWKATYYRLTEHFLNSYEFEDKIQRRIWELHSMGQSFRDIAEALESNPSRVYKTVRRLKTIMFERNSDEE